MQPESTRLTTIMHNSLNKSENIRFRILVQWLRQPT